jgi:hypothetical protein
VNHVHNNSGGIPGFDLALTVVVIMTGDVTPASRRYSMPEMLKSSKLIAAGGMVK